jgi:UDP-glucuronate 4-epimerase
VVYPWTSPSSTTRVDREGGSAAGNEPVSAAAVSASNSPPGLEGAVVTGVAGFLGSHLAEALVQHGTSVTGLDVRTPADRSAAGNLAVLVEQPNFRLVRADLRTAELGPVLARSPVVFHLAALAGVRSSWGGRFADYLGANVLGTQRLLEACEQAAVRRVVLASSSSVYGCHRGKPSGEDDVPRPASPYGVSKLAAERLALAYATRPGARTSVVALRYFTVYGPRQRPDMWIGRVLRAALDGRAVHLHGDGSQRRDFTYVDDAVAAVLAAGVVPAQAEVVNVGGGRTASMLDVLDLAAEVTGRPVPVVRGVTAPGDVAITEADLDRARHLLGYAPGTDLRTGVSRQWSWLTSTHDAAHCSQHATSSGVM